MNTIKMKLIIFDLDGVLVSTKLIHYDSLNNALKFYGYDPIDYQEHLTKYDGHGTRYKLNLLLSENKIKEADLESLYNKKQELTFDLLTQIEVNDVLLEIIRYIKSQNIKIYVASNSIKKSLVIVLEKLQIIDLIDGYFSNEDVLEQKPDPEIYLKCMQGISPKDTLIFEDSLVGLVGALRSGSYVKQIYDPSELTCAFVKETLDNLTIGSFQLLNRPKLNLNIVIPMAGLGSRFVKAGYDKPKPLIPINGKPMISLVCDNLFVNAYFIFIINSEHEKYNVSDLLKQISPDCTIIKVDKVTEGAACSVLLASEYINNDVELVIANSDQYVEWSSNFLEFLMRASEYSAAISSFTATDPKWSFALVENDLVKKVAEKIPISNIATTGIYYWKKGSDFVKYANQMISKNIRVNNEFYVCPVFNEAIEDNKRITVIECKHMHGLGTPEDLDNYKSIFSE